MRTKKGLLSLLVVTLLALSLVTACSPPDGNPVLRRNLAVYRDGMCFLATSV